MTSAPPAAPNSAPAVPTPSRAARATVLASSTLTIMAAAVIAPSLPAMTTQFAATSGAEVLVRLTLTATSLAIAVTAPFAGLVADRAGRRPLLIASLAGYALAGTAGLYLTDLELLLASRVLLGIGVGGIMTAVSAIGTDWFDGPRRASFLGLQQAFASLGGVLFLPLAGALAQISWRTPFAVYAVAVAIVPLAVVFLTESAGHSTRTVPVAPAASTAATAATVTARRTIAGIYALALAGSVIFFMLPTQLPFSLATFEASPAATGAVIAASTLTAAAGALVFPRLHRRVPSVGITAASLALLGAGWVLAGTATSLVQIVGGILLGGIGIGLSMPDLNLRLSELAHPARRARVLSGLVVAIFLGQFLSPLVMQPLIDASSVAAAFTWSGVALALAAATLTGAALAAPAFRNRRPAS